MKNYIKMNKIHKFGGWAIQEACFNLIREILPEGKTILEMGSGEGTHILSEYYNMISIEDQPEWVGRYKSHYIEVPIRNYVKNNIKTSGLFKFEDNNLYTAPDLPGEKSPTQQGWYDYEILTEKLKGLKYDLILIDGPNGTIGRGGFLKHIDIFNTNVPIMIDDAGREAEKQLMIKLSKVLKRPYKIIDQEKEGFATTGYIL